MQFFSLRRPGTSRPSLDGETESLSQLITAPDLQLDCLYDTDDSEQVRAGSYFESDSSSSDDSNISISDQDLELDDIHVSPRRRKRPRRRSLPATASSSVVPKVRRLNGDLQLQHALFSSEPRARSSNISPSSNMYLPHASLWRRQYIHRELQRRYGLSYPEEGQEVPPPPPLPFVSFIAIRSYRSPTNLDSLPLPSRWLSHPMPDSLAANSFWRTPTHCWVPTSPG